MFLLEDHDPCGCVSLLKTPVSGKGTHSQKKRGLRGGSAKKSRPLFIFKLFEHLPCTVRELWHFPLYLYFIIKSNIDLSCLAFRSRDYTFRYREISLLHCAISFQSFFSYFPTLRGLFAISYPSRLLSAPYTRPQIYLSFHSSSPFYYSTLNSIKFLSSPKLAI